MALQSYEVEKSRNNWLDLGDIMSGLTTSRVAFNAMIDRFLDSAFYQLVGYLIKAVVKLKMPLNQCIRY